MKAPDFLVIGAQKAGSTWIYDCLKQHPEVFMPEAVELLYFQKLNYAEDTVRAAYFEHFEKADRFARVGEKTPGYFWSTDRNRSLTQPPANHNPDIPGAVRDILGDKVDFITSLRHPVWRAISAFGHHAKRHRIDPAKRMPQVANGMGILDIGFYGAHLDTWIKAIGRDRLEVLIFEDDIVRDPKSGFRKICKFLKVDDSYIPENLHDISNVGVSREVSETGIKVKGHPLPISPDDITYLLDAYASDIETTKNILGRDLASWDAETARLREWCTSARKVIAAK